MLFNFCPLPFHFVADEPSKRPGDDCKALKKLKRMKQN